MFVSNHLIEFYRLITYLCSSFPFAIGTSMMENTSFDSVEVYTKAWTSSARVIP